MLLRLESYWTPKAGNRDDEYEDAFAPGPGPTPDTGGYRFAVADGATESSYSQFWAELLGRTAMNGRLDLSDPASLAGLQREWDASVADRPLPWFAEEKVRQGAFAALVVLELRDTPERVWRAAAVGDSCLFHIRAGELLASFPLRQAADFEIRPYLIGSRSDCGEVVARASFEDNAWEPGDEFLLMSDALARWFLTEAEAGRRAHDEIARLPEASEQNGFRDWVDGLRRVRCLRNDDTTLLRITATV
jgi:hypothetical protein